MASPDKRSFFRAADAGYWLLVGYYYLTYCGFPVFAARGAWPFVPFVGMLENVRWLAYPLALVLAVAPLGVLFPRARRWAAGMTGAGLWLFVLGSQAFYTTATLALGAIFLVAGLARNVPRALRWQLALIYAAAGLNKVLDPAWWTGEYFRAFAATFASDYNPVLAWAGRTDWAVMLLSGYTIVTELLLLPTLLIFVRRPRYLWWVGGTLHVGMLLLTLGRLSWHYLFVMLGAYLLITYDKGARPRVHAER